MKHQKRKWMLLLCIAAGLAVLNYPFLSQLVNQRTQNTVITTYKTKLSNLTEAETKSLIQGAADYNQKLADSQTTLLDAFSKSEDADASYEELLNPDGSGIMAYVEIPAIKVSLPVYHGTSARVLEAGAGHLEGSSLPVGGKSTHAVISAHNGLPSKLLFTDLDQLQKKDQFSLFVLGEELLYEVDQIQIVEPEDTNELKIEKGKDYVTLVTCTPYGVNSHRYLVRGHRIPLEEKQDTDRQTQGKRETGQLVLLASLAGLIGAVVFLYLPKRKKR